jgi:hypothetical protein
MLEKPDTIRNGLRIIGSLVFAAPESFARLFWPESPNWESRAGRQIAAGAGLLGRMCALGFVDQFRGRYFLTAKGRLYLTLAIAGAPEASNPVVFSRSVVCIPSRRLRRRRARALARRAKRPIVRRRWRRLSKRETRHLAHVMNAWELIHS